VSRPLGTVHTTTCRRDKLRISRVKRGVFQNKQDVRLNPELKIADGEKDALRLLTARAPILFEASGERLFLLAGLELCQ
jgi:hypothetical protein